jgi:hypothetical protein
LSILSRVLESKTVAADVSIEELAKRSAALVAGDLINMLARAELEAVRRCFRKLVPPNCHQYDMLIVDHMQPYIGLNGCFDRHVHRDGRFSRRSQQRQGDLF